MKASADNHFLAGRSVMTTIVNPLQTNEQGLFKRADCK
jgi:hypothetical protein